MPIAPKIAPILHPQPVPGMDRWKLEDAKARLSEVVRLAATNGPQMVTIRGKEAAVILAPEEYRQLLPKPEGHLPLVQFLQGLNLDGLDLTRETDTGRELVL
jgi:prevent-host-death family protein